MKNPISKCLFVLGTLVILGAFISGIIIATEDYYGFQFSIAVSWWSSGIIVGIFLIGIGEIINLLQKILEQKSDSFQSTKESKIPVNNENVSPINNTVTEIVDDEEIRIKDLTIMLNEERFKGQFLFNKDELKIYKKSLFQNENDTQLIKTIKRNNISTAYENSKDYYIFTINEENNTFRLGYKTYNAYEYQKIIDLFQKNN